METFIYLFIGFIIAFINWFFVLSKDIKDRVNIILAFPLSLILWPAIVICWAYFKLPEYIIKLYYLLSCKDIL